MNRTTKWLWIVTWVGLFLSMPFAETGSDWFLAFPAPILLLAVVAYRMETRR